MARARFSIRLLDDSTGNPISDGIYTWIRAAYFGTAPVTGPSGLRIFNIGAENGGGRYRENVQDGLYYLFTGTESDFVSSSQSSIVGILQVGAKINRIEFNTITVPKANDTSNPLAVTLEFDNFTPGNSIASGNFPYSFNDLPTVLIENRTSDPNQNVVGLLDGTVIVTANSYPTKSTLQMDIAVLNPGGGAIAEDGEAAIVLIWENSFIGYTS